MRRFYSDSAKAKKLLSDAFQKLETQGKSSEIKKEIINAAKELDIPTTLVDSVYDATQTATDKTKQPQLTPAQKQKMLHQTNIDMFGPPKSEQYESSEFQYDDLPSLAHLHLEEHRTAREFIRSACYELPLLVQYRSEYTPPTSKENLRFKHYNFVGEEDHPASPKITLTFTPESTNIPEDRIHTLKVLAGRRYDSSKNEIKISSSSFPTQAQNKRHLAQIYTKLVAAAQESDALSDVQVDQRHVLKRLKKERKQLEWPEEWSTQ